MLKTMLPQPGVLHRRQHQHFRHLHPLLFRHFPQLYDHFEPVYPRHVIIKNEQFEVQGGLTFV